LKKKKNEKMKTKKKLKTRSAWWPRCDLGFCTELRVWVLKQFHCLFAKMNWVPRFHAFLFSAQSRLCSWLSFSSPAGGNLPVQQFIAITIRCLIAFSCSSRIDRFFKAFSRV
jgi:hypothetical protein